ncbi:Peroxisomal targeting signal 1 receptor, putative [Pediculus humanus corporis]|uniref:Peroxisomal targeting signal 1 receptor n=1 Tax=Pediculus humanus subsp. corporis TaxID=121224 RepID=E0W1D4_PEDHC|nr:Peroxisomal targeting signal 1 receptor, putative [Pediculus humanus corporis]EEB19440.1 Peroxisomal targeting signal 1 receptor, putative [Pediculus humanus corporis]
MSYHNLLDGDCGGQNPLVKLGSHFSQDQAFRQNRVHPLSPDFTQADLLVHEFLEDNLTQNVQTFRMDELFREMRDIESNSTSGGKHSIWAQEFTNSESNESEQQKLLFPTDPSLSIPIYTEQNMIMPNDLNMAPRENESLIKEGGGGCDGDKLRPNQYGLGKDWVENFLKNGDEKVDDKTKFSDQFWKKLQKEWEKMSEAEGSKSWEKEYADFIDPFKEYTFDAENPMKETENPFECGLKKLEENDLPSAVLCFEAAAQIDPENPLVWQYLGTTQAENEQDPRAISALKKCISLQSDNLTALMSLAISYTNENYQNQACQMLKQWLQNNPKYSDLVKDSSKGNYYNISSLLSSNIHQEVKEMFIAAANKCPTGEIDVDVQCGLGVLFNLSNEIDKAADCFKAALQARPKDFRMWNRLGATLANGHRSEEAVDAYYNALHLSPGFIRARYNLGITCVNLGANREAAEHLLTALNQQAKGRNSQGDVGIMSESIWTTLKMVVNLLGKQELLAAVDARDLTTLNKEFNIK